MLMPLNSSKESLEAAERGGAAHWTKEEGDRDAQGPDSAKKKKKKVKAVKKVPTALEKSLESAFASTSSFPMIAKRLGVYCPENDAKLKDAKRKKQMAESNINDQIINRQIAIISSMTPKEKRNPKILNASRKRRIAMGSGTEVSEINKLIKLYRQTSDMMKKFGKRGMLDQDLGVQDIDKSEINKLNDSKLSEKMLSDLQKGSAGSKLPGLPGLPSSQNKLSNLLNITGRKK